MSERRVEEVVLPLGVCWDWFCCLLVKLEGEEEAGLQEHLYLVGELPGRYHDEYHRGCKTSVV